MWMRKIDEVQSQSPYTSYKLFFNNRYLFFNYLYCLLIQIIIKPCWNVYLLSESWIWNLIAKLFSVGSTSLLYKSILLLTRYTCRNRLTTSGERPNTIHFWIAWIEWKYMKEWWGVRKECPSHMWRKTWNCMLGLVSLLLFPCMECDLHRWSIRAWEENIESLPCWSIDEEIVQGLKEKR